MQPSAAQSWLELTLKPDDRILVLAPHPDDEVLGCAGIIQKAVRMHLPLRVVFLTYGDSNQWSFLIYRRRPVFGSQAVQQMGLVRHDEAVAASKVLGVDPGNLTFLGYPDFGTIQIWYSHWGDRPPFRSMLTRVTAVPYANAHRPGSAYKGEEVLNDLTAMIREFRPTKVFVSHPADHMPDHAALYLFTRIALWDMERELRPDVYPYLVHFKRWPRPRGLRDVDLTPPAVLLHAVKWVEDRLNAADVAQKLAAIRAHRTQYAYSRTYLSSFIRPNELFGDFPTVMLRAEVPTVPLAVSGPSAQVEPDEGLTDQERAVFVGIEEKSARLEGDRLVLTVKFSRPLARTVRASIFVFGYRGDRGFPTMPKLHIQLGTIGYAVYDQDRRLLPEAISVRRGFRHVTLSIPLARLGDPDRILTSSRTYVGDVPLDWVSWRVLELPWAAHPSAQGRP